MGIAMTFAERPSDAIHLPPLDLWSDEPLLDSDLHREQMELLLACLRWWWRDRTDYYASGNLTIYYSETKITTRDFRGPDFFVVLGTGNHPRRSWMLWAEDGKYPNVIIELLSNSTATVDRTQKKQLYQDTFRTPEYFWFHPETMEFEGFRLMAGRYHPIKPNAQGWRWSQQLGLFLGICDRQLRYFTTDGQMVPSPEERANHTQQELEALQAKLRALGIDPDAPTPNL